MATISSIFRSAFQTCITIGPERFWSSPIHKVIVNVTKTLVCMMVELKNETSFNWIKWENWSQLIRSHKNIPSKYRYMENRECRWLTKKQHTKLAIKLFYHFKFKMILIGSILKTENTSFGTLIKITYWIFRSVDFQTSNKSINSKITN